MYVQKRNCFFTTQAGHFKHIVYWIFLLGSEQWRPTFKQFSHLPNKQSQGFLRHPPPSSLGITKMMFKKCPHTHTHTHPPADGNLAASTTPIASLSGNTLLFSQWKITPKRVHNQKQISHMQARDRDASHPKSYSAKMFNVAHGGRSSCPCSHIGMNHVLVCVRSLAVI